jgi:hypothetical protein
VGRGIRQDELGAWRVIPPRLLHGRRIDPFKRAANSVMPMLPSRAAQQIAAVTRSKMVCFEQPSSFPRAKLVTSPKQLRAMVTERRYRAPARTPWEVKMNIGPSQDLFFVFDDKAVRAMGPRLIRLVTRFGTSRISTECVSSSQSASLKRPKMASAIRSASTGKQSWGLASMRCRSLLIAYAASSPSRSTRRSRD